MAIQHYSKATLEKYGARFTKSLSTEIRVSWAEHGYTEYIYVGIMNQSNPSKARFYIAREGLNHTRNFLFNFPARGFGYTKIFHSVCTNDSLKAYCTSEIMYYLFACMVDAARLMLRNS